MLVLVIGRCRFNKTTEHDYEHEHEHEKGFEAARGLAYATK
ncbi:MAG: hypothetical protein NTW86_28335 [Candidatus Sumerlaeota bacterium]|nr:hypothetical protein [Candidatus Sumerlaeota bacterium]